MPYVDTFKHNRPKVVLRNWKYSNTFASETFKLISYMKTIVR